MKRVLPRSKSPILLPSMMADLDSFLDRRPEERGSIIKAPGVEKCEQRTVGKNTKCVMNELTGSFTPEITETIESIFSSVFAVKH